MVIALQCRNILTFCLSPYKVFKYMFLLIIF